MRTKKNLLYIVLVVFFAFLSVYILFFERDFTNHGQCEKKKSFYSSHFRCTVVNKFIDKPNHSFETIEFDNCSKFIVVPGDTSGLFNFLRPGDILVKKKDSEKIVVQRASEEFDFLLYFGCND
jgi:hypothetical protein